MQPENQNRATTALEIEALARSRDMNEINEASRSAEAEVVRDFAARGMLRSGGFGERIAAIHRDRARRMVDRQIALRGESLKKVPELGTKEHFKSLLDSVHSTIEGVFRSIPEHLRNRGAQVAHDAIHKKSEYECVNLKAHAQREIEILKREHQLERAKQEKLVKTVIRFGDNTIFQGDVTVAVAKKIEGSFNKAQAAASSDDIKELLQQLVPEVAKVAEKLSENEAADVAYDLERLTYEATKDNPKRK